MKLPKLSSDEKFLLGATLGLIGLVWLTRKYSNMSMAEMREMMGGSKDRVQFTIKNNTGSIQYARLFDGRSRTPVKQQNPNLQVSSSSGIEFFTQTLNQDPLPLESIQVWSQNTSQISQPIPMVVKNANGDELRTNPIPFTSPFQPQAGAATVDMQGYYLDGGSVISGYPVLPNTTVRLVVKFARSI